MQREKTRYRMSCASSSGPTSEATLTMRYGSFLWVSLRQSEPLARPEAKSKGDVFISYAAEDGAFVEQLKAHMKGAVTPWHDRSSPLGSAVLPHIGPIRKPIVFREQGHRFLERDLTSAWPVATMSSSIRWRNSVMTHLLRPQSSLTLAGIDSEQCVSENSARRLRRRQRVYRAAVSFNKG